MNIVVLHCHFQRGGVTQVVANHVRALADRDSIDKIVLVSGGRIDGLSNQTIDATDQIVIDGFDYDSIDKKLDASNLTATLTDALNAKGISPQNSVLHWHNHSLGKNHAAPGAIRLLAQTGWRLLLQVHDFAEDNRPANYAEIIQASDSKTKQDVDNFLYPVANQIHYAALTRTDASVFNELGVPASQTHCLPNSVSSSSADAIDQDESLRAVRKALGLPDDSRWTLYPVRGIRRKNVGEFLLLSRLLPEQTHAGITLCPTTPVEKRSYDRWKEIAQTNAPRAVFDAGMQDDVSFAQNVSATEYILSTSVAEGFGMVFLEPWLVSRGVIARDLPTVTSDFIENSMQFPMLYDQIPIPGDTSWISECRAETAAAFANAWSAVPVEFRPKAMDADRSYTTAEQSQIDFAQLTPARSIEVLNRMANDSGFETEITLRSPDLIRELGAPIQQSVVENNRQRVRSIYDLSKQADDLIAVYGNLLNRELSRDVCGPPNAGVAMDTISKARPYYPCRTEELS